MRPVACLFVCLMLPRSRGNTVQHSGAILEECLCDASTASGSIHGPPDEAGDKPVENDAASIKRQQSAAAAQRSVRNKRACVMQSRHQARLTDLMPRSRHRPRSTDLTMRRWSRASRTKTLLPRSKRRHSAAAAQCSVRCGTCACLVQACGIRLDQSTSR